LAAGRIDAYLADSPVVAYAVKQTGDKFEMVGEDQGTAPYGIALPKDPAALTTTVQQAMQKLIDSGAYQKILDNWGVSSGAITNSVINGATN
jgi:polar amino acid transport system substrate-binding protein